MIKKLKILMMLVLLSTQFGWTQSSSNWTVSKINNDTTINYRFTKTNLSNLRVYVTELEGKEKLYTLDKQEIKEKDGQINNLKEQVQNRDSIIKSQNTISYSKDVDIANLKDSCNVIKKSEIKYKKRAKLLPYATGGGGLIGFLLCIMLVIL